MESINGQEIYQYHTLSNGMRIVHRPLESDVAYCGVAVRAGSANETETQYGLAHFVEHTLFKGTKRRRSYHIINRMERVGGELNAYTSKEETMIYSTFPTQYYSRAIELMGDLVSNSVFPAEELDKEREVVLDEVESYLDIPSEAIYDDFEDLIFANTPLGHNILGNEQSLKNLLSADCRNFIDTWYVPENMVFFSYGRIPFYSLCRLLEKHFGCLHKKLEQSHIKASDILPSQFQRKHSIDSHQSHTIYGARVQGMYNDKKYALALLNNIIGGPGMNSLLNVSLREKHGYVYTVESSVTHYIDTGLFSIYFGCDHNHTAKCIKLIEQTIDKLADKQLSEKSLSMAKRQYIGQLLVASDNKENLALSMGKSLLYFNHVQDNATTFERIMSITPEGLRDAASMLTPDKASSLTFSN